MGEIEVNLLPRNVNIHNRLWKHLWNIRVRRTTEYLIIGDDNVRLFEGLPNNWETHCYPEADYDNIQPVLRQLPTQAEIGKRIDVILSIGIQHRGQPYSSFARDLRQTHLLLEATGHRTHFLGISILEGETPTHRSTINAINIVWQLLKPNTYIPPLSNTRVAGWDNDFSILPILYGPDTAREIQGNLYVHLINRLPDPIIITPDDNTVDIVDLSTRTRENRDQGTQTEPTQGQEIRIQISSSPQPWILEVNL